MAVLMVAVVMVMVVADQGRFRGMDQGIDRNLMVAVMDLSAVQEKKFVSADLDQDLLLYLFPWRYSDK
jgi:hypothetical protein